jgi:hypothetical protein
MKTCGGSNDDVVVGQSLREFGLQKRLFRYSCSYLIHSASFDALPQPIISSVVRRMKDVLLHRDSREKYGHISLPIGADTLQILRETKAVFSEGDD